METLHLKEDCFYHIYNKGNNGQNIYIEEKNYTYFLYLYKKYVTPIADTYSWCLLNNHFHFLIRIKKSTEINLEELKYSTIKKPKLITASSQFSHFFNAYSQAINKTYHRTGSLFEKPFKRKQILDENYLKNLITYINLNPVHHNVVTSLHNYKWTSYHTFTSNQKSEIKKSFVLDLFGDLNNFIAYHQTFSNFETIEDLIIE